MTLQPDKSRRKFVALLWLVSLVLVFLAGRQHSSSRTSLLDSPLVLPTLSPVVDFDQGIKLEGSGIADVCAQTRWNVDRILWCDDISVNDGFGDVRNAVLHCLRYSIEAGAHLLLPSLRAKKVSSEDQLESRVGLDYFFDLPAFKRGMKQHCPQMTVYNKMKEIHGYEVSKIPAPLNPRTLHALKEGELHDDSWFINEHTATFRKDLDAVLPGGPLLIRLQTPTAFQWPIETDSDPFWRNFGRLLEIRNDSQSLASEIYTELIGITPGYLGLNFEEAVSTSASVDWDGLATLTRTTLAAALRLSQTVIYAAGPLPGIEKLTRLSAIDGVTVLHKEHLLHPDSLQYLHGMSVEQQATVDYQVFLLSSHFQGMASSSTSQNIVSKRLLMARADQLVIAEKDFLVDSESYPYFPRSIWP